MKCQITKVMPNHICNNEADAELEIAALEDGKREVTMKIIHICEECARILVFALMEPANEREV